MKDITIKGKHIKREITIIISLYILANLINVIAIIVYKTGWNEIYTSQKFVLFITEWLYIASIVIRLLYSGIRYLVKK